ncbi:MAG: hypothetical protein ACQETR_10760, partial [Thermodesulfobacteriota bacterium]
MGLFDGVPVLGDVEDAAGNALDAGKERVGDLLETPGETINEIGEFLQDPAGYVQDKLSNLSLRDVTSAVSLGLDNVVEGMAREAGLGPLVDGVSAFVDEISDVVDRVLQMVKCAVWVENPTFWAVVAGIYAARAQGIIKSKGDCEQFVTGDEFLRAVGATSVPLLDLLPCAIEAAFLAPLPAPGTVAGTPVSNIGGRAAENLSSSALGKAAGITDDQSLANIRNAARPPSVSTVVRSTDKLDIVVVRANGSVVTAAWQLGDTDWRGWWSIANGRATSGTPVTAVSRSKDKLDIFMVGLDGRVWTAAWQPGDTSWRGWWPIGNLKTLPGTPVGVVSRSADMLDVFVTSADGIVHTAAWQSGDTNWRGWWPVANGRATPGTPVTAVSRSKDKLDIFMVGLDGRVWTAAWQPGDTSWRGWWPIGNLK